MTNETAGGGLVKFTVEGDELTGGGEVTPVEGDCATAPVTKASSQAKYTINLPD